MLPANTNTFTATLREDDGHYSLDVPSDLVKDLHLEAGAPLEGVAEGNQIIFSSKPRKYSLAQLLEEHAQVIDELGENREWIDAPAVGRELI